MENQFSLKIDSPCAQDFKNFSTTGKGGFCGACKKEVIDFTDMDTEQIITYFKTEATQNTCGRFKNGQLTTYHNNIRKGNRFRFSSGLAAACIALFSFGKMNGQAVAKEAKEMDQRNPKVQDTIRQKRIAVTGTVTENGVPLPGANVYLEGSEIGVVTDFDGYFEFPEKLEEGSVLVVSYIGFKSKKVTVQDRAATQNIAMEINLNVDSCILMGKVAVNKVYRSKKD
ncbi:carboxypeptidase-like regulatory domain-containing protein [Maribacter sp. 2-571]|uniref:carboxypeptidase-like regulatory domain-containing protein n=1 Tax=Maribacter sp. 2-571 TaxID=3417569 RepID=UPI003D325937